MKIIKIVIIPLVLLVVILSASPAFAGDAGGSLSTGAETGVSGVVKAAPTATPSAGTYIGTQNVILAATGSTAIYYTVDGTTPSSTNGTLYTTAISVPAAITIQSIAYYGDGSSGPVNSASYTITSGGGFAGGGSPTISTTTPPPGATDVTNVVSSTGTFTSTVTAPSSDDVASVTVPSGTIGLTASGAPLTQITVTPVSSPPNPPADVNAVGLNYNYGPNGAKFSQPVTLTLKYDPSLLPAGADPTKLYIAWWDTTTGQWVNLPSVVDTVSHIITAQVSHFTLFAVLVPIKPAVNASTTTTTNTTTTTPVPVLSSQVPTTPTTKPSTTTTPTTPATTPTQPTTHTTTNSPTTTTAKTGISGGIIAVIAAIVIVICVLALVMAIRRKK